jgi:hypothetical protein
MACSKAYAANVVDSFYISMLSEQYKNGKPNNTKAALNWVAI